ncbi:hypothetical protein INT44_005942 [Umbelopsis vinacea]|uniref:Late endosomal/lysosomal adaptor and MAPK and MTOR activator 5 n=1 Tax=Umbelopsis vinacea TaxID=44442 RepID=A0A8H7UEP5_9FUNG|nr:hypothetical protein INT44_005942 [Umbelopsis vinacea]KAI9283091.1 hepatitis B virus X-interacting protein [Umbelopsis sp. AD052]
MEYSLEQVLDKISEKEGVKGVLVADESGLCLGTRGIAKSAGAAFVASIANSARSLSDVSEIEDKSQYSTVSIELESYKIIIRNEGSFTIAVFQ